MSLYSELVGYKEAERGPFELANPGQAHSDTPSITTHSYNLGKGSGVETVLKLIKSHAPDPNYRPLYYAPCSIEGELVLDVQKKPMDVKEIIISVEGIDQGGGYGRANAGQGVHGEPGDHIPAFFRTATPDLLTTDSNETGGHLTEGTHSFPFSLSIPETFNPNAASSHSAGGKSSLKEKVGALLGHKKSAGDDGEEAQQIEPELAEEGAAPLPPSFLRHNQQVMDEVVKEHDHDSGIVAAEYAIHVYVKYGGLLTPDMSVEQTIIILPLRDQQLRQSSKPMAAGSNMERGVQA